MSDLPIVALALSARMVTAKSTPRATRRCRKRSRRAMESLLDAPTVTHLQSAVAADPEEAMQWFKRVCGVCGKCRGV